MRWLFILALLTPFVSAYNISIAYPEEVNFNESFEVNLSLIDFSGIYDVKIDIFGQDRISEINNAGVWQSTNYYVSRAINTSERNSSLFQLRISVPYSGEGNMTVRVRNSDSTSWYRTFSNYIIKVNNTTAPADTLPANNTTTAPTTTTPAAPFILVESPLEIENGREIEVSCKYGNTDSGDVKIYIEFQGELISEIYDSSEKSWKSGVYYSSMEDRYRIRIKKDFSDVSGDATLVWKLRKSSKVVDEGSAGIKIGLAKEKGEETEEVTQQEEVAAPRDAGPVLLNSPGEKEVLVYESRNERVRKNIVFVFCGVLIVLLAYALMKR